MGNKRTNPVDKRDAIKAFNTNVKNMLFALMADEKIRESVNIINYYYLQYNDKGCEARSIKIKDLQKKEQNNNDIVNYYWVEYEKNSEQYRLCMFYKDFDHGSGNIHVLPGIIQLWKRCPNCEEYFHVNKYETSVDDEKVGQNAYKADGGKMYCEEGWKPIWSNKVDKSSEFLLIWCSNIDQEKINNENGNFYTERAEEFWNFINAPEGVGPEKWSKTKLTSSFYGKLKEVIYDGIGRTCNGRNLYHLLRWKMIEDNYMQAYYKMVYVKGYGYFCIYDGKPHVYRLKHCTHCCKCCHMQYNPLGPNYFDPVEKKWRINYTEIE